MFTTRTTRPRPEPITDPASAARQLMPCAFEALTLAHRTHELIDTARDLADVAGASVDPMRDRLLSAALVNLQTQILDLVNEVAVFMSSERPSPPAEEPRYEQQPRVQMLFRPADVRKHAGGVVPCWPLDADGKAIVPDGQTYLSLAQAMAISGTCEAALRERFRCVFPRLFDGAQTAEGSEVRHVE
jgi:hypothetical protein